MGQGSSKQKSATVFKKGRAQLNVMMGKVIQKALEKDERQKRWSHPELG